MDLMHSLQRANVSSDTVIYSRRMYGTERLLAAFAYVVIFSPSHYAIPIFSNKTCVNCIVNMSTAVATPSLDVHCLSRIGACPVINSWNMQKRRGSEHDLTRLGLHTERLKIHSCRIHGFNHTRPHWHYRALMSLYTRGQRKPSCGGKKSIR